MSPWHLRPPYTDSCFSPTHLRLDVPSLSLSLFLSHFLISGLWISLYVRRVSCTVRFLFRIWRQRLKNGKGKGNCAMRISERCFFLAPAWQDLYCTCCSCSSSSPPLLLYLLPCLQWPLPSILTGSAFSSLNLYDELFCNKVCFLGRWSLFTFFYDTSYRE